MNFSMLSHDIMEMIWVEKVKIEKLAKVVKSAKKQYPRVLNELKEVHKHFFVGYVEEDDTEDGYSIVYEPRGVTGSKLLEHIKYLKDMSMYDLDELKGRFWESPLGRFMYLIKDRGYEELPLNIKFNLRDTKLYGYGGNMSMRDYKVKYNKEKKAKYDLVIRDLHLYFYNYQYDEERYPTFRCADKIEVGFSEEDMDFIDGGGLELSFSEPPEQQYIIQFYA